jgi:methyl-accepting chemotaxis protein
MWMKNFRARIGTRLIGSFLILLAVLALTTSFALWRLHAANEMAHTLVHDKLARQQLAADWLAAVSRNGVRANAIAKSDSLEVGDYFRKQLDSGEEALAALRQQAAAKTNSAQEATLLAAIDQARQAYNGVRDQVFQFKESGRTIEVEALLTSKMEPGFAAYEAAIAALLAHQKQQADALARQSDERYQSSIWMLAALGALAVSIGAILAWSLTNSLVKPLRHAIDMASKVADGDLTVTMETDRIDEVGDLLRALDRMSSGLSGAVEGVREGVGVMGHSIGTIAADNAKLAARTSEQAATLEQLAASMEELTATVKENTDHATVAAQLAHSASGIAQQGGEAVLQVVHSMDLINQSSQKISSIIGVIDGIAFQTNILALNAAVEAARAGEQGRGFAVVASEVRSLAKRSAVAAKEIKDLIQDSGDEIKRGGKLVKNAGTTMEEIVRSVAKVTALMTEISVASKEQSAALGQISNAIVHIDEVTQQNAALVVDAAESAEFLQERSLQLAHAVSIFKLAGTTSAGTGEAIVPVSKNDSERVAAAIASGPENLKLVSGAR